MPESIKNQTQIVKSVPRVTDGISKYWALALFILALLDKPVGLEAATVGAEGDAIRLPVIPEISVSVFPELNG